MCDRFCVTSGYSTIVRVTEYVTQPLSGWQSMLLNHCQGDRVCFSTTVRVTEYLTQPLSGWQSILLNRCRGDIVCYSTTVRVTEYVTQPLSGWQSMLLNHCLGDRVSYSTAVQVTEYACWVCTLEWFPEIRLHVHKLAARRTKLPAHSYCCVGYLNTFWEN